MFKKRRKVKSASRYVRTIAHLHFATGPEMLEWAQATAHWLWLWEQLLLTSATDVKARLSRTRWRFWAGQLPPSVRAWLVVRHLTRSASTVRSSIIALETFERELDAVYLEPARQAARNRAKEERRGGGESSQDRVTVAAAEMGAGL